MGTLDIILIIPIVWFAWRGFSKGLILSITSLVALFAGIYFSIHFSGWVANWLVIELSWDGQHVNIVSFIITFIVVVVVIQLIGRLFDSVVDWAALGILNRVGGLLLGLVKSVLFLGILLFVVNNFDTNNKLITQQMRTGSYLYEPLSSVVPEIWPRVKEWFPQKYEQTEEAEPGISV
ncbi:MAG: CvpA family protein [Bacteroidales bacterium]|nr:CvpA family protein [Bacteroidales bacterium]